MRFLGCCEWFRPERGMELCVCVCVLVSVCVEIRTRFVERCARCLPNALYTLSQVNECVLHTAWQLRALGRLLIVHSDQRLNTRVLQHNTNTTS